MEKIFTLAVAVTLCLAAQAVQAGITGVGTYQVDNSAVPALDGYMTFDINISFEGQYTGAQILFDSGVAGGIYQDPVGSALPPNALFLPTFPSLEFDTFLGQGSDRSGGADGEPSPGGGAVDLGGESGARFDSQAINQAFNPAGGVTILDRSDFFIARITLRNDVSGYLFLLASAGGEPSSFTIPIPIIPEPASVTLSFFSLLALLGSRPHFRRGGSGHERWLSADAVGAAAH